jgi:hypothetical protein
MSIYLDIKTGQEKDIDKDQINTYYPLAKEGNIKVDFDEENHIYSKNGIIIPSVTGVLSILSDYNYNNPAGIEAAKRGTYVHKVTAYIDSGIKVKNIIPEVQGYIDQWELFKIEHSLNNAEVIIEQRFISKHGYCGTLDRIYQNNEKDILMLVYLRPDKYEVQIVKFNKALFNEFKCYLVTYNRKNKK